MTEVPVAIPGEQRFSILRSIGSAVVMVMALLEQPTLGQEITIHEFQPRSMLRNIRQTELSHARFPAIDVHTHFGLRQRGDESALDEFVEIMDRNWIAICVSLDEKLSADCGDHLRFLSDRYPGRFVAFTWIDFQGKGETNKPETWACNQPEFVHQVTLMLEEAHRKGIAGVKFFKQFGLGYRNADGTLIEIDDTRWDPVWATCARLDMPVLIHTGDPAAFFEPIDRFNERAEELSRHPNWSFHGDGFPTREAILKARNRVIERHPETKFIGAHMGGNPEDLKAVGEWLDRYPNLYVDIASRIAELGRQPFTARDFLIRYQDRVLFATDGPWPEERLRYYWRFLETHDEYFRYSEKEPPPQGLWQIYGVQLPEEVLAKLYFKNALTLLPQMQEAYNSFDSN